MSTSERPVEVESSHHWTRTTSWFRARCSPYLQLFFLLNSHPASRRILSCCETPSPCFRRETVTQDTTATDDCIGSTWSRVPATWFTTSQRILSLISGAGAEQPQFSTMYGILQFVYGKLAYNVAPFLSCRSRGSSHNLHRYPLWQPRLASLPHSASAADFRAIARLCCDFVSEQRTLN